jgi:putative sterol carrier protein
MTEKEFYKARAEGWDKILELRSDYNTSAFFELLDLAEQIVKENNPNFSAHREEKLLAKVKYRKALNALNFHDKF